MSAALLFLLFQSSAWTIAPSPVTVGDTVYLTRQFDTTPDVWARLRPLEATLELEPLVPPRWMFAEGELTVTYTIALFESGRRSIALPDIELVHADGQLETILGDTAWVEVVTLLPGGDTMVPPMPSQGPLVRQRTTSLPLVALLTAMVVGLIGWVVLRRRRGARPSIGEPEEPDEGPPIDVWVASGESRAVAAVMASRLRDVIAARIPEAGRHLHTEECIRAVLEADSGELARQVADALRALERARFSPAAPGDVLEVVDQAEAVIAALETAPGESTPSASTPAES